MSEGNGNDVVSGAHVSDPAPVGFKLVGYDKFVRTNPRSDRFGILRFHHFEFWCGDATNAARRFSWGLGMPIAAKSDLSTGNSVHASYLLRSGDLDFLFTAPYSPEISPGDGDASAAVPTFSHDACRRFTAAHGLGVRAIAVEVDDAVVAYRTSVAHGARASSLPIDLDDTTTIAEVELYGDVVLRYVSHKSSKSPKPGPPFLPRFEPVDQGASAPADFGIRRVDHAPANVAEIGPAMSYIRRFTGMHEFAEFTAEDVGTSESGMNSVILANDGETVLLALNEPVHGTKLKSQIQAYLEHNEGAGVQHLALASEDIFRTVREMRKRSGFGGFEFLTPPPPTYYENLRKRVGDVLTDEQIEECEELGILVDRDDEGKLLQIFTKHLRDRPTIFLEIIQRVGCMLKDENGREYQKSACGGFGKGNFSELFKSMEEYDKILEAKRMVNTT